MDINVLDIDYWWPILVGEVSVLDYLSHEEVLMMQKLDDWCFFI